MNSIKITDYKYEERIAQMADFFGVEPTEDCDEHALNFDNGVGTGSIQGINFDQGVSVMLLDVILNEDLTIQFELGRRHPVLFLYNMQDDLILDSGDDISHTLQHREAMIFAPQGSKDYSMVFQANKKVRIIFASVIRYLFLSKVECDLNTIPNPLKRMFADTVGAEAFYFKSVSDPILINIITKLYTRNSSGLERKLHLESHSLKLITSLIKTFRIEANMDTSEYRYSSENIKSLNKAKDYLIDNIAIKTTVKQLSKLTGMNTNKLQKGFHMLFGKSIRQFTISFKMHTALSLMDSGEYSISEIAHKIGYTNKGHFSQLFKKEFGILPSEYVRKIPASYSSK